MNEHEIIIRKPPVPVEEITPPPEELFDSCGNRRALVNTKKLRYVEIDDFGYYPSLEFFYDIDNNLRGFSCPEGLYAKGGHDEKCVYWKIKRDDYISKGPYLALIKFSETAPEVQTHVLDGKYDRIIELPTAEGMLFFDDYIADAIVESKELADWIMKDGLLSVRHYIPGHITDENDPFLEVIAGQNGD